MLGGESGGFVHEALLYHGAGDLLEGVVPFVEAGLAADEVVVVVVPPPSAEAIRAALGADAEGVRFLDMEVVGRNPARILPLWRDLVRSHATGRGVRGVGEPVWPGRSDPELAECHLHEHLLNVAFDDGPAWRLMCPYDTAGLDAAAVAPAASTHPVVAGPDGRGPSDAYGTALPAPFARRLPEPPEGWEDIAIAPGPLADLRRFVAAGAARSGLDIGRAEDLVLAVCEVATNTLVHGGGSGRARLWEQDGSLVCEVLDEAPGAPWPPLAGRERPSPDQVGGRGLWLANQLCDLVQIHADAAGSAVRVHVRLS